MHGPTQIFNPVALVAAQKQKTIMHGFDLF